MRGNPQNCRLLQQYFEFRPPVIADDGVIAAKLFYVLHFFCVYLRFSGSLRFPKNFASNREISPLFSCEIRLNDFVRCAAKVIDPVRKIFANIDLAIGVSDFVYHFEHAK